MATDNDLRASSGLIESYKDLKSNEKAFSFDLVSVLKVSLVASSHERASLESISRSSQRRLQRLVHRFYPSVELNIIYRRGFRISNMFNYKDKFPLSCRSMVVYYTQCKNCGPSEAYIGKTVNTVYERFFASGTGHLSANNKNSALIDHMVKTGNPECDFVFDDVKILDTGSYDEQIRFIESILLKYDKQNLNTCERSIELQLV